MTMHVEHGPEAGTQRPGLEWAIRRSFLQYIARSDDGRCSASDGAEPLDGAGFRFTPLPARDGVYPFVGDVRFSAHHGVLFLAFTDPVIRVHGSSATLSVADHIEDSGGHTVMATATVRQSAVDGYEVIIGEHVELTAAGSEMFAGSYQPGELLDPFTIITGVPAFTT